MTRRPLVVIAASVAVVLLGLSGCGSSSTAASSSTAVTSSSAGASVTSAAADGSTAASSGPASSSSEPAASPAASASPSTSISPSPSATTGPASSPASSSPAGGGIAGCAPADLALKKAGTLTVATSEPAYEPWVVDDDPTNGKGYESAVAYAIAAKLGLARTAVAWTRISFNAAISPAPKNFDFDINQFSISEDRKKAVDFSTGYYDVTQAVVTTKTSPLAKATTIADLKGAKLGAQIGTTSLTALRNQIAPAANPTIYQTNDTAVQALKNGQIDGLVLDLPTAFYVSGAELDNGVLVGQLPQAGGTPEQFGLLLEKGSGLTACASKAVDAVRADGTLAKLTAQWLTKAGAPELK